MKKLYLFIVIVLLTSSCSAPKLAFKPRIQTNQLGIYLEDSDVVPKDIQRKFQEELDDYILEYNSNPNSQFRLQRSTDPAGSTQINLKLQGTKLVTNGQQAAAVTVSAIGLSLPFVMVAAGSQFYIFFYYFPKDISVFNTSLSSDISDESITSLNKTHYNSGFLRSEEKQIEKHTEKFDKFMGALMKELEKDYSKKLRQQLRARK